MKKEFACPKRPWKSTNNASNVLIIFPNGTLSSGLRLHKRSGILFMTDYLRQLSLILSWRTFLAGNGIAAQLFHNMAGSSIRRYAGWRSG